jgi:U3 small nucleolar ribonucleoprotein component
MKTIREIADELGVDKQKVYRFIKQNRINEAHHEALQRNGVKYYDEAAEALIKQGLSVNDVSSEAHHEVLHDVLQNRINETVFDAVIERLQKELDRKNEQLAVKDKQIEELNARLAEVSSALVAAQQTAQAAQALHAGTLQSQLADGGCSIDVLRQRTEECTERKKGWIWKLFGCNK